MFDPDLAFVLRRQAWKGEHHDLPAVPPGTSGEQAALQQLDAERQHELRGRGRQLRPVITLHATQGEGGAQ